MEGILLYVSILAICYVMVISVGKMRYTAEEIAYRVMLVVLSIELVMTWLFSTGLIASFPHLMRVNSPLDFLFAPSFFVYVSSRLFNREQLGFRDLPHLIPFLLMFIYLLPFYVMSADEKLALYTEWLGGKRVDWVPVELFYSIQLNIYAVAIVIVAIRKWTNVDRFVLIVASAFMVLWGIEVLRLVTQTRMSHFIWLHFVSFLPLLIFFELRFNRKGKKYATSGMDDSKVNDIANDAYELISQKGLFRNPKLTLNDVSSHLNLHNNYVSQSINASFKMNFNELVRVMRVQEAKRLLADQDNNYLTLEAIASMAGFNSISNFNASFKKLEKKTPSAYKKTAQTE